MITPEVWIFIIGAIITVVGSYFAAKVAGRASVKVAEVSADEGAYVRAQEIYEKAISQLERENKILRLRVTALEHRVMELEGTKKTKEEEEDA